MYDRHAMPRVAAQLVRRAHDEVDFVVVTRRLAPELRELARWRAVPTPGAPYDRRWRFFFLAAPAGLAGSRADLVHVLGAGPIVPNRADLLTAHMSFAALAEATPGADDGFFRLQRRLERWYFGHGRARLVGLPSLGAGHDFERHWPGVETTIVPNGVDHGRFRPDAGERRRRRAAAGVADDELVALFVGNDWGRKGLDLVVEALARAPDWRLWVLGQGPEERFRELAERQGVAERVTFLGAQDETAGFYQAADAFVLPTSFEMLSLAMLEAAATGLPLVVTPVHGVEEIVGDDDGGFVVERDAGAVAGALTRLASSASVRTALGSEARHRCLERFSWDRCVAATLAAYERLVA